jgi:hypothetical protein
MYDRVRALDLIERAIDSDPYCPTCHAPTTITDDGGHIRLECSAANAAHGRIARILAAVYPHIRRDILDLSDGVAA